MELWCDDDTMMRWWWRNGAVMMTQWCGDDVAMELQCVGVGEDDAMVRWCVDAICQCLWSEDAMATERHHLTFPRCGIAIATSHHSAIEYLAHALFVRKWRQMKIYVDAICQCLWSEDAMATERHHLTFSRCGIAIASSHHSTIEFLAHALFARKWCQM